ncbi:MAG: hypothetical protein WCS94_10700 [Verrucomicrobiota bacterium]
MMRYSLGLPLSVQVLCLVQLICPLVILVGAFPQPVKASLNVQLGQNFTAATMFIDSAKVPPDTDGAVGPEHFVEFINGRFSVFAKDSGAKVLSMTDLDFWAGAGVKLGSNLDVSDTRVIFDPLSGRWFASQVDFDRANLVNNRFLLAVSASNDPTGLWQAVAFTADPGGNFADFPRLGIDANGVYLSANMFDGFGNYVGVLVTSIPKSDLLGPDPTAINRTCSGVMGPPSLGFSLQPVVNFNPTSKTEAVLAVPEDGTFNDGIHFLPQNELLMFQIFDAVTPSASLGTNQLLSVPSYLVNFNPPQPDGQVTLDDGDARIGSFVFQVGDSIYATHAVQVGTRAAIRWYRISAASQTLLESGTISDPDLDLFYPSIAAATNGMVVIGFNGCSINNFISAYAVAGQTINEVTRFGDKILLKAGTANYEESVNGSNRWGDYSTTTVDAGNPNHFWTIQEFASANNVWSTQVTELVLAETPPVLQIMTTPDTCSLSWSTNNIGYTLEVASDPISGNWQTVPNLVSVAGNQNKVILPVTTGNQFFRLRR